MAGSAPVRRGASGPARLAGSDRPGRPAGDEDRHAAAGGRRPYVVRPALRHPRTALRRLALAPTAHVGGATGNPLLARHDGVAGGRVAAVPPEGLRHEAGRRGHEPRRRLPGTVDHAGPGGGGRFRRRRHRRLRRAHAGAGVRRRRRRRDGGHGAELVPLPRGGQRRKAGEGAAPQSRHGAERALGVRLLRPDVGAPRGHRAGRHARHRRRGPALHVGHAAADPRIVHPWGRRPVRPPPLPEARSLFARSVPDGRRGPGLSRRRQPAPGPRRGRHGPEPCGPGRDARRDARRLPGRIPEDAVRSTGRRLVRRLGGHPRGGGRPGRPGAGGAGRA